MHGNRVRVEISRYLLGFNYVANVVYKWQCRGRDEVNIPCNALTVRVGDTRRLTFHPTTDSFGEKQTWSLTSEIL